jgi:hypothetical protein
VHDTNPARMPLIDDAKSYTPDWILTKNRTVMQAVAAETVV